VESGATSDKGTTAVEQTAAGFWSMARYETPILTVVSNNHCYESVRKGFASYNGRMMAANRFAGMILDNPLIDFVGLVRSQGCDGIRVERPADLRPALKRGIEATRAGIPFLIAVDVARTGPGRQHLVPEIQRC
jgi:benzoylformate decarboxylase